MAFIITITLSNYIYLILFQFYFGSI